MANEVVGLRIDVMKLHGHIEPFEGESVRPYPDEIARPRILAGLIETISDARSDILAIERDGSRIRGVVDAIDADATARPEMKPLLRE